MKTIFGDVVLGWNNFPDNQLTRCPVHKKFEAVMVRLLPKGCSFLDVGAHFGDTIITMAMRAKTINRLDIRFFAFEPNTLKCDHIRKIARLNGLTSVCVINTGVGDKRTRIQTDGMSDELTGACSYREAPDGAAAMIKLDDVQGQVEPVGFLHIDVEGWEAKVILGAQKIIQNPINRICIVAECWTTFRYKRRNFGTDPCMDIAHSMKPHDTYTRYADLVDIQTNLVFAPKRSCNIQRLLVICQGIQNKKKRKTTPRKLL